MRVKKALFDSTRVAIENGDLESATNDEEVKTALASAQGFHVDNKLVQKAYDKYKNGSKVVNFFKKILERWRK